MLFNAGSFAMLRSTDSIALRDSRQKKGASLNPAPVKSVDRATQYQLLRN
jgi:hypothetical protein